MSKRIYISGGMSKVPREEYLQRFHDAEVKLKAERHTKVVNPCRVWSCRWPWLFKITGYKLTLLYDIWLLMHCDAIYMLQGWSNSKGACIEHTVACSFAIERIYEDIC